MAASSTAKLFSSPGFGHIDPSVERGQLRKEIESTDHSRLESLAYLNLPERRVLKGYNQFRDADRVRLAGPHEGRVAARVGPIGGGPKLKQNLHHPMAFIALLTR